MFFWCRLFDASAQYIDLIIATLLDIGHFTSILALLLVTFGTGMHVLQVNRIVNNEGGLSPLYDYDEDAVVWLFFESFFVQYKMLLGDYEGFNFTRSHEDYTDQMTSAIITENFLVRLYFVGTTFFTQITLLNMLIAIMSNTFARHSQSLSDLGKRQKLLLMAEYLFLINFYQKYVCCCKRRGHDGKSTRSLFMMTPIIGNDDEHDEAQESQRQINLLHKSIEQRFNALENIMHRQMVKEIRSLSNDTKTRMNALEKD